VTAIMVISASSFTTRLAICFLVESPDAELYHGALIDALHHQHQAQRYRDMGGVDRAARRLGELRCASAKSSFRGVPPEYARGGTAIHFRRRESCLETFDAC
jgi:hypothetical protein